MCLIGDLRASQYSSLYPFLVSMIRHSLRADGISVKDVSASRPRASSGIVLSPVERPFYSRFGPLHLSLAVPIDIPLIQRVQRTPF
jgi:hypothetical protein